MPEITDILELKSVQLSTQATSQTLTEMGLVIEPQTRRVRLTFDLNSADPTDSAVIGRYTYDTQPATDSFGVQFQYGTVMNLSIDEAINMEFIKLSTASAVNFMVDQFRYEQQML